MKKSVLLSVLVGVALWSAAAAPPSAAVRPPNIVFILVDDMGWADVGCFGSQYHETPNPNYKPSKTAALTPKQEQQAAEALVHRSAVD